MEYRKERDSIGEKYVEKDAYYGVQSLRGYENFRISGLNINKEFIKNLAIVKKSCAITNEKTGELLKLVMRYMMENILINLL